MKLYRNYICIVYINIFSYIETLLHVICYFHLQIIDLATILKIIN